MTATDELRAELTKRGIEWRWQDERTTYWYVTVDGEEWGEWKATEMGGYLFLDFSSGEILTPAQAIAATLGPTDPRERGLIPHFWTGDWTLHIEAARLPKRIDVTLPDQRGREVYSARVHRFVPERTCHIEQTGHVKVAGVDYYDDDYECSECGAEMFEGYNFCPNCGRKVVDE